MPRVVATKAADAPELREFELRIKRSATVRFSAWKDSGLRGNGIPVVQVRLIVSSDKPRGRTTGGFNLAICRDGSALDQMYCEQYFRR